VYLYLVQKPSAGSRERCRGKSPRIASRLAMMRASVSINNKSQRNYCGTCSDVHYSRGPIFFLPRITNKLRGRVLSEAGTVQSFQIAARTRLHSGTDKLAPDSNAILPRLRQQSELPRHSYLRAVHTDRPAQHRVQLRAIVNPSSNK
jgi:hypothetical protein